MNLIAVDIGNTNINVGLFLKGEQKSTDSLRGANQKALSRLIADLWQKIPVARHSKEKKRNGIVVAGSVKPGWTKLVGEVVRSTTGEKMLIVGRDIPYPIELGVKEPAKVGSDRVVAASAAYAVVEKAVVVADFGTAVTIDLVDDRGVFVGGVIFPGFEMSARALHRHTAQLPGVSVTKPKRPFGRTTTEAINAGLYYVAVSTLQEVVRRYAELIGTWPQTVITGSAAALIKDDCKFIDNYVPNLVIKGIALAYKKFIEQKE